MSVPYDLDKETWFATGTEANRPLDQETLRKLHLGTRYDELDTPELYVLVRDAAGVRSWRSASNGIAGGAIGLINRSTNVTDAQARIIAQALNVQLTNHVGEIWPTKGGMRVRFVADETEFNGAPDLYPLALLDVLPFDAGVAAGYHGWSGDGRFPLEPFPYAGRPYGVVTTADAAALGILTGLFPVSLIASHEALELKAHPRLQDTAACHLYSVCAARRIDQPADTTDGSPFISVRATYEIADPVFVMGYLTTVAGTTVTLSNFVSEAYFFEPFRFGQLGVPGAPVPPPGTRWDLLGVPGVSPQGPFDTSAGALGMIFEPTSVMGVQIIPPAVRNPAFSQCDESLDPPPPDPPPGSARVARGLPFEFLRTVGAFPYVGGNGVPRGQTVTIYERGLPGPSRPSEEPLEAAPEAGERAGRLRVLNAQSRPQVAPYARGASASDLRELGPEEYERVYRAVYGRGEPWAR